MRIFTILIIILLGIPNLISKGSGIGSVKGQVIGEKGKPMARATVMILDSTGRVLNGSFTKPDSFEYNIDSLPEGNYFVKATYVGYENRKFPIKIFADSILNLDIKMSEIKEIIGKEPTDI